MKTLSQVSEGATVTIRTKDSRTGYFTRRTVTVAARTDEYGQVLVRFLGRSLVLPGAVTVLA